MIHVFRCRYQHQVISILEFLEKNHYITFSQLGRKKLIKITITDWRKDNTALNYSYPCKKDAGFFFFPIAKVHELISMGKCSEMDIILDLWIHDLNSLICASWFSFSSIWTVCFLTSP